MIRHLFSAVIIFILAIRATPVPESSESSGSLLGPPRVAKGYAIVSTPLGFASGSITSQGSYQFPVKYASAGRWKVSAMATNWVLPNGSKNVSTIPLPCPQDGLDPSGYSEDCLSMVLYVPSTLTSLKTNVPVLVWIHGGSFVAGGISNPGLDGSALAIATNSIVAVIQYRLGALGFMAPCGSTNLGAKDVVIALHFLKKVIPSFGGDASKVTIAGQSSGANMIRALLAAPSAASLFKQAILQSDPMDFGFLSVKTKASAQVAYNSFIKCESTDYRCMIKLSVPTILAAQNNYTNIAMSIDPSVGTGEPIRVVKDGQFITTSLDSTSPFPAVTKSVLITNVQNEAGYPIYGYFSDPVPEDVYPVVLNATFGTERTNTIMKASYYQIPTGYERAKYDSRIQLQTVGTDQIYRCPSWTFGRNWVANGGKAYIGLYRLGAPYPGNSDVPYCTSSGTVCHQDDIMIVFGTVSNPSAAQAKLIKEMQARYSAFLRTGIPNAAGYATWEPSTTTNVHALNLGTSGEAPAKACDPSFWGQAVQYDYQVYAD